MEAAMSNSVVFGLVLSSLPLGAKGSCTITNVALGKPSYQLSTSSNGQRFVSMEKNAVDGNTDGDFRHNSCTHTDLRADQSMPQWKVDLGLAYKIEYIRLYNRLDCCSERLSMVEITVSRDSSFVEGKLFAYIPGRIGNAKTIYPDNGPMSGQWVKIGLKQVEVLTLCEVEVFARKKMKTMDFVWGQGGTGREQHIKAVPLMTLVQAMGDCRKCNEENFAITVSETYMEYECEI